MILNLFEEDGALFQFFVFSLLMFGHITWAIIQHQIPTPLTMYTLFIVTCIETILIADSSRFSLIHLINRKEE